MVFIWRQLHPLRKWFENQPYLILVNLGSFGGKRFGSTWYLGSLSSSYLYMLEFSLSTNDEFLLNCREWSRENSLKGFKPRSAEWHSNWMFQKVYPPAWIWTSYSVAGWCHSDNKTTGNAVSTGKLNRKWPSFNRNNSISWKKLKIRFSSDLCHNMIAFDRVFIHRRGQDFVE